MTAKYFPNAMQEPGYCLAVYSSITHVEKIQLSVGVGWPVVLPTPLYPEHVMRRDNGDVVVACNTEGSKNNS